MRMFYFICFIDFMNMNIFQFVWEKDFAQYISKANKDRQSIKKHSINTCLFGSFVYKAEWCAIDIWSEHGLLLRKMVDSTSVDTTLSGSIGSVVQILLSLTY